MNKIIINLLALIFLISCDSEIKITKKNPDNGVNTPIKNDIDFISMDNLSISNITENDFTVNAYINTNDFSDKIITLYYCNSTSTPSCSPKSGTSKVLSNSSFVSEVIKNLDSSIFNGGDSISLILEIEKNGNIIDSLNTSFTLKESPEMLLSILSNDKDGEASIDFPTNFFNIDGEGGEQVFLGNWGGSGENKMWLFLNFTLTKDIPSGSTINSSFLTLGGDGRYNWDTNNYYANVYIQDTDNATPPSEYDDAPNEANGTLVLSPVRWPSTGGLFWEQVNTSPNISSLIQELVDKYEGLSAGSNIQIWVSTPSYGSAAQLIYADFGHANHKADLSINWSY